jgi:methionine-rich copper-binding protein CopC
VIGRALIARHRRLPAWLLVLIVLLIASVMAERAKADVALQETSQAEQQPRAVWLASGSGTALALTFDHAANHASSQLTLVTPGGSTRKVLVRLTAQPNTLYASLGRLAPGDYTLQWYARLADGTSLDGSVSFKAL